MCVRVCAHSLEGTPFSSPCSNDLQGLQEKLVTKIACPPTRQNRSNPEVSSMIFNGEKMSPLEEKKRPQIEDSPLPSSTTCNPERGHVYPANPLSHYPLLGLSPIPKRTVPPFDVGICSVFDPSGAHAVWPRTLSFCAKTHTHTFEKRKW